jgi:hypothetical protein
MKVILFRFLTPKFIQTASQKKLDFEKLNQEAHNLCGYTVSDQFDLKNRDVVAIKNWRKTLDDICIQNANDSNVLLVKLIMTKIDKGLEAL